jgi:murein DD-endopeptidase MepM/ murein hydrolase activator NlpD
VLAIAATGFFVNYRYTVNIANAEKTELLRLREVTGNQYAQLEQLAKKTASLQEDVGRLNMLDAEIRRMVDVEAAPVSRSGGRSARYNGQGGAVAEPNVEQLNSLVEDLNSTVKVRERSLAELKQKITQHNARQAVTPSIWPTGGDVTSRFGWRSSPFGWGSDWHPGIDIANDHGTPIMATANGQVIMSGWFGGYGKCVQVDHGNGIVTLYGHNSQNVVDVGSIVKKGEVIAYMGSTGASTGSHVHYEIRVNGTAVNPANFL